MRFALAQINATVGDLVRNADKVIAACRRAADARVHVVVTPELALCGYPPKDLLLRADFIDEEARQVERVARQTAALGLDVLVGCVTRNADDVGRPLRNAAALLRGGKVLSRHHKTLLPTYDVFDESRYFEPGRNDPDNNVIRVSPDDTRRDGYAAGVTVCEDLWNDERLIDRRLYHQNPVSDVRLAGAEVVVNLSASPFVVGKHAFRLKLFAEQARKNGVPLVYCNQVGGNDELIFDGCSCVFDARGNLVAHAKAFEEDLLVADVDAGDNRVETAPEGIASMRRALVLGTRDYFHKCGFKKAVIGLSGGIDSAVVAAVAVEALGGENVTGVALPSRYSSSHSVDDARQLAANLGVAFHVVPIAAMHDAFADVLGGVFPVTGLTEENLQARIRGSTLMAFSNRHGSLLLTTGNKSEIAVGYCTLYGDMAGGLALLSDVPKTDVYRLARHYNDHAGAEVVPENTLTKPPSAELAPDQKDSDSLPDYDTLDAILERYVEDLESPGEIVEATGYDRDTVEKVVRLIDRSEYKRRQAAPGLKVTSRAFGVGRRMPIAQRFDPLLPHAGKPAPETTYRGGDDV